jgi:hypothetical protein
MDGAESCIHDITRLRYFVAVAEDGAKSELKAGAKIIAFVAKQSDGTLASKRVLVGRDGITPPM